MTEVVRAIQRSAVGTSASRRLRKGGLVPAIIYGEHQEPINISVNQDRIFRAVNRPEFHTSLIELELDGKTLKVVIRAFQMHHFKPSVQHVDFQMVSQKPIKIKVPLIFLNAESAVSVKLHGSIIFKIAHSVDIITQPNSIPQTLTVDLGNILPGQILHVSDIVLPDGVESVALKRGENPPILSVSGKSK